MAFPEAANRLQCLYKIGGRLHPNDIEKLHFICVGSIPEGQLHELTGASLIREIAKIGTNEWVTEALIRIGRIDLLRLLKEDHESAMTMYSSLNTTHFNKLRIALFYKSNNMTDAAGLEIIKDAAEPRITDKRRLQHVHTALELFDILIQNGILTDSRPETVIDVCSIYLRKPWFEKVMNEYVLVAPARETEAPSPQNSDNSNDDATTGGKHPSNSDSGDKGCEIKGEKLHPANTVNVSDFDDSSDDASKPGTNSSNYDPGDSNDDTNTQETLSEPDDRRNTETSPGTQSLLSDVDVKHHSDPNSEGNYQEHDNKTVDDGAQEKVPSILAEDDAKPCSDQEASGGNTNDDNDDDDQPCSDQAASGAKTNDDNDGNDQPSSDQAALNNSAELRTRVIEDDDGTSFENSFDQEETSRPSTLTTMNTEPESEDCIVYPHQAPSATTSQAEYPMTRNPRGWAVIFNIENFAKVPNDPTSMELQDRPGSSKDAESLESAFKKLHFNVERHDNKTLTDIIALTDGYASRDHSSRDCFVICVLTHGSEGKLFDVYGHPFQFEQIFKRFHTDKCPTLSGKPKLFFLQACQGNQPGVGL